MYILCRSRPDMHERIERDVVIELIMQRHLSISGQDAAVMLLDQTTGDNRLYVNEFEFILHVTCEEENNADSSPTTG